MNSLSTIKVSAVFLLCVSVLCACAQEFQPPQIVVEKRVDDLITVNVTHIGGVRVVNSSVYRVNGATHADITISINPNVAPANYAARSTWFNEKGEIIPQATDFVQIGDFLNFTMKRLTWRAPNPHGHHVVIDFSTTN